MTLIIDTSIENARSKLVWIARPGEPNRKPCLGLWFEPAVLKLVYAPMPVPFVITPQTVSFEISGVLDPDNLRAGLVAGAELRTLIDEVHCAAIIDRALLTACRSFSGALERLYCRGPLAPSGPALTAYDSWMYGIDADAIFKELRLRRLFIFVPPDKLAQYRNGFPIVIRGVELEDVEIRQKHDRHDGDLVKSAKQAFEIEIFRLTGRQTAVEQARNTLTDSEAEHRARQTMGVAAYREKAGSKFKIIVPTFATIMGLIDGLIDRGRRLVKAFFAIPAPNDLNDAFFMKPLISAMAAALGKTPPRNA